MSEFYTDLIKKLKKYFGKYDETLHRFENKSNSEIARELGYSDAQFSRLINGSATDGEYQRAIQNLDRILYIDQLEEELSISKKGLSFRRKKRFWFAMLIVAILSIIGSFFFNDLILEKNTVSAPPSRDYTLKWTFENAYIKPYTKFNNLPSDCNFPCYKYQGRWKLQKPYKLPFFREQNGYHYQATEVSMFATCENQDNPSGQNLDGYEYQQHEIWYDIQERSVDTFILQEGQLKDSYQALELSEKVGFVRVALVHTLFKNSFKIDSLHVERSGKVIGRDVELIDEITLSKAGLSEKLIKEIKSEVNSIARVRLQDFSRPVSCSDALVPNSDFHLIKDGDLLAFNCQLTTSRMSLDYTKTYELVDQYIKNTCQPIND